MKNSNVALKVACGVLLGAAIGGVLGILYAPDKGRKTSRKIIRETNDFADHVKIKVHSLLEGMKNEVCTATDKANDLMRVEKSLNSKIMKVTMKLQDQYPELYQHIEEMTMTIPTETNQEVSLKNLKAYYDSLVTMLGQYIANHPTDAQVESQKAIPQTGNS